MAGVLKKSIIASVSLWGKRALVIGIAVLALVSALSFAPSALAATDSAVMYRVTQSFVTTPVEQEHSLAFADVAVEDQWCTGDVVKPFPKVMLNGRALIQFVDYRCSYENNSVPGTAKVTVIGMGAYTGSQSATFEIEGRADLAKASVIVSEQTFTGLELTPAPKVVFAGEELVIGRDYDVSYADNVNVGTASITITGKKPFFNSQTVSFKVRKADVANVEIGAMSAMAFTGKALKPRPAVKFEGLLLMPGVDYRLSYKNNVASGMATVIVAGRGNFTGAKSAQFKITKDSLKRAKINPIAPEYIIASEEKTPVPKVICNGKRLRANIDYTLSYKNNNKLGKATVIVRGIGVYSGIAVAKFDILNIGDKLARKVCELSYSQQRWAKNGYKGTKAYLANYGQFKALNAKSPISCSVGMHVVMRASGYDSTFTTNTAEDCKYLNFWSKNAGNEKWKCLGDYKSGMELLPGDILLGDKHKGVNHIFMYVGPEIAQEVYESSLKGIDSDCGAPTGEWVSAHAGYHGGSALCICEYKNASAGGKYFKVFRCIKPDWL